MIFHIWIIVNLPFDTENLITGLTHKKYEVSPASEDGKILLTSDGANYSNVALRVKREIINTEELYYDIQSSLTQHNYKYYSIIISEYSNHSMWSAGNVLNDNMMLFSNKTYKNTIN